MEIGGKKLRKEDQVSKVKHNPHNKNTTGLAEVITRPTKRKNRAAPILKGEGEVKQKSQVFKEGR